MPGDRQPFVLPGHSRRLLDAARTVLATPGLPPVVLVGGLAVTMRISAAGVGHRATVDIDLVTIETEPEVVEVLAEAHQTDRHRLLIEGVKVDLISTLAVDSDDLDRSPRRGPPVPGRTPVGIRRGRDCSSHSHRIRTARGPGGDLESRGRSARSGRGFLVLGMPSATALTNFIP